MKSVIVATSDNSVFSSIRSALRSEFQFVQAQDLLRCQQLFRSRYRELSFIDLALLNEGGLSAGLRGHCRRVFTEMRKLYPTAGLIAMAPKKSIRDAVSAVKAGADNFITYPIDAEEIRYVVESYFEERIQSTDMNYFRDPFWGKEALEVVRTNSPSMKAVFDKIRSVAPTKTTVLLTGETGTGKNMIAGLIHAHSNRQNSQFTSVHCGAIPDTLLESELFGHEKGAFTGAIRRKLGKFEIAHKGTLFLDEIATISAAAQIKLLKVLQDQTFQRVGGEETIETDVRVVAATNVDLWQMTIAGSFRKDLYYRLNVFPIDIPPLTERLNDIPLLVQSFLKRLNKFYAKQIEDVHPLVMEAFNRYSWPGNIRELENLIERSYILEKSHTLTTETFPADLFTPNPQIAQVHFNSTRTLAEVRRIGIENIERQYLKELLLRNKGRIDKSAENAGISTRQLHKLMCKYAIRKEEFK